MVAGAGRHACLPASGRIDRIGAGRAWMLEPPFADMAEGIARAVRSLA